MSVPPARNHPPVSALDLLCWLRWAGEAKEEGEEKTRLDRINRFLYPPGISEEDRKSREETTDFVKKFGQPPSWAGFSDPCPPPDEDPAGGRIALPAVPELPVVPPPPVLKPWGGLIPTDSPVYRRGGLHDGTLQETKKLREFATGSPFDALKMYDEEEKRVQEAQKRLRIREREEDE